jgi:MFS family permease
MGWLGGVVRRWAALMGSLATLAGAVAFALTEHVAWAWLAIIALLVLVVCLVLELWSVQRREASPYGAVFDRAVADGRALLTLPEGSGYQWDEWRAWQRATSQQLRQRVGSQAVYDFEKAAEYERRPRGERIAAQITVLETLRSER